jgi:hypothetical protein
LKSSIGAMFFKFSIKKLVNKIVNCVRLYMDNI